MSTSLLSLSEVTPSDVVFSISEDSPFLFTWTTACLLVRSLQLKNHLLIESDRDHFGCYGFKIDFPLKLDLYAYCKNYFAKIF